MLTLYSQILVNVPLPVVTYRKGHGLKIVWFELFKLFPVFMPVNLNGKNAGYRSHSRVFEGVKIYRNFRCC